MIESIQGAYNAIKGGLEIAQGFQALKTETAINQAVIEIQRGFLEAQRALNDAEARHSADLRGITELEQEILRLKDWSTERKNYDFHQIGEMAFVYAQKTDVETRDPPHWLCAKCFDDSYRGLLQWTGKVTSPQGGLGQIAEWQCNRCASLISVSLRDTPGCV